MNIIHPANATLLPGPEGVVALPVIHDSTGYYSYWMPDEKELALLNAGCAVQLGIHHNVHPVVSMAVSFAEGQRVEGAYSDETVTRVAHAILKALEVDPTDLKSAVAVGLDTL